MMSNVTVIADQSGVSTTMAVVVNGMFRFIEPKLDISEALMSIDKGECYTNDFFEVSESYDEKLDLGARAIVIRCLASGKRMVYPYSDLIRLKN